MKSYSTYACGEMRSDDADSTVISTVLVFPILLMMLITMIEMPIFFSNRNLLQNDLRQGARTAAILGGNGANPANRLAATYADKAACSTRVDLTDASGGRTGSQVITSVYSGGKRVVKSNKDVVACETAVGIVQNKGYIAFNVYNVNCGPDLTSRIGQSTWCEADYYYDGIPGGAMSLIGGWNHFGYSHAADVEKIRDNNSKQTGEMQDSSDSDVENHGFNSGTLRMSAQSEVCLASDCRASGH